MAACAHWLSTASAAVTAARTLLARCVAVCGPAFGTCTQYPHRELVLAGAEGARGVRQREPGAQEGAIGAALDADARGAGHPEADLAAHQLRLAVRGRGSGRAGGGVVIRPSLPAPAAVLHESREACASKPRATAPAQPLVCLSMQSTAPTRALRACTRACAHHLPASQPGAPHLHVDPRRFQRLRAWRHVEAHQRPHHVPRHVLRPAGRVQRCKQSTVCTALQPTGRQRRWRRRLQAVSPSHPPARAPVLLHKQAGGGAPAGAHRCRDLGCAWGWQEWVVGRWGPRVKRAVGGAAVQRAARLSELPAVRGAAALQHSAPPTLRSLMSLGLSRASVGAQRGGPVLAARAVSDRSCCGKSAV